MFNIPNSGMKFKLTKDFYFNLDGQWRNRDVWEELTGTIFKDLHYSEETGRSLYRVGNNHVNLYRIKETKYVKKPVVLYKGTILKVHKIIHNVTYRQDNYVHFKFCSGKLKGKNIFLSLEDSNKLPVKKYE